jgi:hypothetical protein
VNTDMPWPQRFVGALRRTGSALRGFAWRHLSILVFVSLGFLLSPLPTGYNHVFAAYLTAGLVLVNLKLWHGEVAVLGLVVAFTNLALCVGMLLTGQADLVPYLGVLLFSSMAMVAALLLVLRRPLTFRERERVAENYLDTALRGTVALVAVVLSLAWIPRPIYVVGPVFLLLGFRLASPLRRLVYPLLLRLAGKQPTDGAAALSPPVLRGLDRPRAVVLVVSVWVVLLVCGPLLTTTRRYDVTIPEPYVFPVEMVEARRAQMESYVATEAGAVDVEALTELGLVYHNLGLEDETYLLRADEVLDRALFLDPDNAQTLAWRGSNRVALAIFRLGPAERLRLVAEGLEELDRAVAMTPDDPVVRLARVDVCLGLPRFFNRLDVAAEDADRLVELLATRPAEAGPLAPLIHQRAGDAYALRQRWEEAQCQWQAAREWFPEASEDYRKIVEQTARVPADRILDTEGEACAKRAAS